MTTNKGFPDDPGQRVEMADRLATEVRALREQLDQLTQGRPRKAERQRLRLMIDTRQWQMSLLNPVKYGKKMKQVRWPG